MSSVALNPILNHVFRSHPEYELVPFGQLGSDHQLLLKDLTDDPDFFGILRPRAPGPRAIKSICRDTARLVHRLTEPGCLPHDALPPLGEDPNQAIAELVLDGVLEIEHEGAFVSGASAYSLIYASPPAQPPQGLLPRLSQAALEYAQRLRLADAALVSRRLYFYNRIPFTSQWAHRLPSEDHVARFLGISGATRLQRLLANWSLVEQDTPHKAWFQWYSRRGRPPGIERPQGYKLYVSPLPEALPESLQAVVEHLDDSAAYAFKVGRTPIGILRPDKLVLYFWEFDGLVRVAREISHALSGSPVHGVPFTAAISEDGLLSWGIDPAPENGSLSPQDTVSWRLWITNRLATALVAASQQLPGPLQPWKFAVERLRLEEIDVDTWAPAHGFGLPSS